MTARRNPYKRPPITEAVIEFQFETGVTRDSIEAASKRLLREHYAFSDPEVAVGIKFDVSGQQPPHAEQNWNGVTVTSLDRVDVVNFRLKSVRTARLAPYDGWDAFRTRAQEAFEVASRSGATARISRVGVRYLNRIDVPPAGDKQIAIEDYLAATLRLPDLDWKPISSYAMQVVRELSSEDNLAVILNSGLVASPLINHTSFVLDLDVYTTVNLPQKADILWALVDRIREEKNSLFEAFITDNARALFNQ